MIKESAFHAGTPGFYPWVGKIPWRRAWQPTPLLPGESHGVRILVGYAVHGVTKSWTRLSNFHTHTPKVAKSTDLFQLTYCLSFWTSLLLYIIDHSNLISFLCDITSDSHLSSLSVLSIPSAPACALILIFPLVLLSAIC